MNQQIIGVFLSKLRREQGLTQKELADRIGVSDKTISKWETCKSIPDIHYMDSLCKALNITMNELISGERLSDEDYSLKAEENIISLIEENNNREKNNRILMIVGTILCIAAFAIIILYGFGAEHLIDGLLFYMDLPNIIILMLMSFGCVFISGARTRNGILNVLRQVTIPCGCLVTLFSLVIVLYNKQTSAVLVPTLATAFLSMIYAMIEYLIVVLISIAKQ